MSQSQSHRPLTQAEHNKEYVIQAIESHDSELENFLFTLGCYVGETIAVVSVMGQSYVVTIKDARYSIDRELAQAILV